MHDLSHQSSPALLLITICYMIFAFQVWYQTNWRQVHLKRAIAVAALIVVFIFCGLSGYASTLWPVTETRWLVREGMHWLLGLASVVLVMTNQAKVFSQMLRLHDGD